MISTNLVGVLIFAASFIIQDEACTRMLRNMKQAMQVPQGLSTPQQGLSTPQQGLSTPQQGLSALQRRPLTLQTPPTSRISSVVPTTISNSNADDVSDNILSRPNPSRTQQDVVTTARNFPLLDLASTRDWIPDGSSQEEKTNKSPPGRPSLSSILNSRRLNAASNSRTQPTNSFYDMAASDETDSETRSVTSALPSGLSNLVPGLSGLVSQLPDVSTVTPSLRAMTPDVSTLSNIPSQVASMSPTSLIPSSGMSSIPGLMYLASNLASAFSSWNAGAEGGANTRDSNNSSPYNFLSYLPAIVSMARSLTPLLSSLGGAGSNDSQLGRSPLNTLANPMSYLPTSLFGSPPAAASTSGGDNKREKSRYRPKKGRSNRYYENSNERDDYDDGAPGAAGRPGQGFRYQYDYSSSPNGQGGSKASSRSNGNGFSYRYQYSSPQQ